MLQTLWKTIWKFLTKLSVLLTCVMNWMFESPSGLYVKTSMWLHLETTFMEVIKFKWDSKRESLIWRCWYPYKERLELSFPTFHTSVRWGSGSHLPARKRALSRSLMSWHLDLGPSITVRNKSPLFKSPSILLWKPKQTNCFSDCVPKFLLRWVEHLGPHRKTYIWMFITTFTHNCPKLEAAKMFFSRWMGKQTGVHSYVEMLFSNKTNELSSHKKIWKNLEYILLSEGSQSEKLTYCFIPTLWPSGKGRALEAVKRSVVARGSVGREGTMNKWNTEFLGQ